MKQILLSLADSKTWLAEVPTPRAAARQVLVHTTRSLISVGTERMLVEFARANWIDKIRQQPDRVREVLMKARTDGVASTVEAVRNKLDQPLELGYSTVGLVADVGEGVRDFTAGDRVVSNGKHAEVVIVPKNLCAKIPDSVSDEAAAFTVIGAIGLQGIRLANPTLGECVVVTGLGLIGLMTVQMLRAQGCRVMGIDVDTKRLELARAFGAQVVNSATDEDVLAKAAAFSQGNGVDAVIITASAKSNELISQAARMCRKRGRIVLVGVVGLDLDRADFYEKELTFQVSCSYGPGRYDPAYEEKGQDYPVGFVRWTEQRNFEAVLDLMASGALNVYPLISHRFAFEQAEDAYSLLTSDEPSLGILLNYGTQSKSRDLSKRSVPLSSTPDPGKASVAFLGAGNYAGRTLIPAFKSAGATLHTVVSGGGVSAVHHGKKHGFANASSDSAEVFADDSVDTVVIATRHDKHASQVLAALRAGKHVFCEKPLCLTLDGIGEIREEVDTRPNQLLMVGFNRRFAPHVVKLKSLLANVSEPKSFVMTVNAGNISADHWTQDRAIGGGRIIGEACHFVDLLRHLCDAPISHRQAMAMSAQPGVANGDDRVSIMLKFGDGSTGTIHYLANGHRGFPKERLEVFVGGRILQLDNFRKLRGWGWNGFSTMNLWRQDKGQRACAKAFVDAVRRGKPSPIPLDEIFEVSRVTIEVATEINS
ncbi:bi-domain-containing oxidoreductase [bacterium AH-315-P15]|nr:bi-domain-containing oxidoreductase [bacterium AH-315-P15]